MLTGEIAPIKSFKSCPREGGNRMERRSGSGVKFQVMPP